MAQEHDSNARTAIGSGRFQRKPRATLARIAETSAADDVRLPNEAEIDDLIAYLTMAKTMGGLTFKQMDAFWDLNNQLLKAQSELRGWVKARPAYDDGQYDEPERDVTAIRWMMSLAGANYETVAKAAYAQFKDEFPMPDGVEGLEHLAP